MSATARTESRRRTLTTTQDVVTIPTVPAHLSRGHDRDRHVCCSSSACS